MKTVNLEILKEIFNNMIDYILIFSPEGKLLYANQSACLFYGYSLDEFIGLKASQIECSLSDIEVVEGLNRIQNENIEKDTIHTRKDGTQIPVKLRALGIELGQYETKAIICLVHDIREIVKVETENFIINTSLNAINEAILIYDENFKVVGWNKKAEDLFGLKKEDVIGKRVYFLVPEDKKEELSEIKSKLYNGEHIEGIVTERLNGVRRVPVQVSYIVVSELVSNSKRYIGIYREFKEEDADRLLFEELKKRAVLALRGGDFGIWDYNFETQEVEVYNHLMNNESIVKNHASVFLQCIAKKEQEAIIKQFSKLTKQNDVIDVEIQFIKDDKQESQWGRLKGKIVEYNLQDRPIRMVGTIENITTNKMLQAKYESINTKLKDMVKIANDANHAKSMFIANMSHEIRTPLNGIIIAAESIEKKGLTDSQQRIFQIIENSANTLNGIVSDILDFSKIEQEHLQIQCDYIDMPKLLQNIMIEIQVGAIKKGLETSFYFEPRTQKIFYGDIQKIKQVLNNLISNAFKFTEDGSIGFRAELVAENEESVDMMFTIKDTGIGIKEESKDKIFDIFYQEDETYSKVYSGTGLGLAISQKYAKAMNGKLRFSSKKGEGSSFFFICRLYKNQKQNQQYNDITIMEVEKPDDSKLQENNRATKKILSVDDNIMNQELLKNILSDNGYEVELVFSPDEAMARMSKFEPDLILMDIQLPGLNGYELTERIRQCIDYKNIPIIAMTAYTRKEDEMKCKRAGMNDFIPKPIRVIKLLEKIEKQLTKEMNECN